MKIRWIGVIVIILLTLTMSAQAEVRQEDVTKLASAIIAKGTVNADVLMVYLQIIEPGTTERRYYASVWFTMTQQGLVPVRMILNEEWWTMQGDNYAILQWIIEDVFLDGVPDTGIKAILLEEVDGTVLDHATAKMEEDELIAKHRELFSKFFLKFTSINL